MTPETCPLGDCGHREHLDKPCQFAVFQYDWNYLGNEVSVPCNCRACPECRGYGAIVTPDGREHDCRECLGNGVAA